MTDAMVNGPTGSDQLARRNALILASAQAVAGAAAPICISLGGIVGYYLLGSDKSLATLPVAAYTVGIAMGTLPAGALSKHFGRRKGLIIGSWLAVLGGLLAAYGIFLFSFTTFCVALTLVGIASAFVQQYRFAAADTASDAFKPKAISWVLAGGVFAAIIGPQTATLAKDLLAPIEFAGAFVGLALLAVVSIVILSFLRFPKPTAEIQIGSGRPLSQIISQPRFLIAVLCAVSAYALMSFVMTAAPLAMVACGHTTGQAILGIQWHVLAMFGPSFITGALIQRFGKEAIVAVGMILLAACAALALTGLELTTFWAALILLGVGWNFGFIGATAMLTETYRPEEKNRVQAVNDFILFGFVAAASLSSGSVLNAFGWETINLVVFPVVAVTLVLLAISKFKRASSAV